LETAKYIFPEDTELKGDIIILKFQNNNTIVLSTFEDFILTTYVIIDDLYKRFVPPEVTHRRNVLKARMSNPEVITICICGELTGVDLEKA